MSSQEWRTVYRTIREIERRLPRPKRRPEFSDVLIVAMYLWAVSHDRPQGWACRRENYSSMFRPKLLPSQSRFSRRIRSERCNRILDGVYGALARPDCPTPVSILDGRPFVIGSSSKDRDARAGRISGGFARGYRLHQLVAEDKRVLCWSLTAMNESEATEALNLVNASVLGPIVLADSVFDGSELYDAVAARGSLLIAGIRDDRLKSQPRANRNSPARLRAVEAWKHGVARYVYKDRKKVEAFFGQQSSYGGGLGPLPAWVRTLPRVRRWIGAKLILHHARLLHQGRVA